MNLWNITLIILFCLPLLSGCFSAGGGATPKNLALDAITLPVQVSAVIVGPISDGKRNRKHRKVNELHEEIEEDPTLIVSRDLTSKSSGHVSYLALQIYLRNIRDKELPQEVISYLFPLGSPSPLDDGLLSTAIYNIKLPQSVIDDYCERILEGEEMHSGTVRAIFFKLSIEELDEITSTYADSEISKIAAKSASVKRNRKEREANEK
ncbi:hypothetical protein QEH56_23030 [Pelagicoccus enzymogenes]|uniref:hypothetical protein n=1 Tax=Pelagicoccus enzymogenes TaxID=2773457 RepID=UPI0028103EB1|nr:hypothetical protein [Pelagicoccus enzymogenes]MDQ8201059.1 hypothetical protein [Pelagicoccus enzymogenes]